MSEFLLVYGWSPGTGFPCFQVLGNIKIQQKIKYFHNYTFPRKQFLLSQQCYKFMIGGKRWPVHSCMQKDVGHRRSKMWYILWKSLIFPNFKKSLFLLKYSCAANR